MSRSKPSKSSRKLQRRQPARQQSSAEFQALENRKLLAGITFNPANGIVSVDGSEAADSVLISSSGTQLNVYLSGVGTQSFAKSGVTEVMFMARGGNDWMRNDTDVRVRAYGQAGADTLIGGSTHDVLNGGPDADILYGYAGADRIIAGGGDDTAYGGVGNDNINGGDGNDNIHAEDGNDTVLGGLGDDYMDTGAGDDTAYGFDGRDAFFGGLGRDGLAGQNGDDWIDGGSGDDSLYGNNGDDDLLGGDDADRLVGGDGNDDLSGNSGDDWMRGGVGMDRLFGQAGSDDLGGDEGDDDLDGGLNDDRLTGGSGNDDYLRDGSDDLFDDSDDYSSQGDFEISGEVSNLNTTAKTFTLLGISVNYASARVEGTLANGAFFKAEGAFASGVLTAHEVEAKQPGQSQDNFEARGTVSDLNTTAKTFQFNGLTVNYATAEVEGTLANGETVKVEGNLASGVVTAREVQNGLGDDGFEESRNFELRGAISNLDTNAKTFSLLGLTVNYSVGVITANLANGAFVKIDGYFDGTGVLAREVQPEINDGRDENVMLRGAIANLNSVDKTFNILGIRVRYGNADLRSNPANGLEVEVQGWFTNLSIDAEEVR